MFRTWSATAKVDLLGHRLSAAMLRQLLFKAREVPEMRRRELLLLLGGAVTRAPDLRAQQKAMPVIPVCIGGGYVSSGAE
jgi:hypothetical protein